jgi:YVTN family beta-propeller protein
MLRTGSTIRCRDRRRDKPVVGADRVEISPLAAVTDDSKVYVTNVGDNTVSVIDVATNTVVGTPILVGNVPMRLYHPRRQQGLCHERIRQHGVSDRRRDKHSTGMPIPWLTPLECVLDGSRSMSRTCSTYVSVIATVTNT